MEGQATLEAQAKLLREQRAVLDQQQAEIMAMQNQVNGQIMQISGTLPAGPSSGLLDALGLGDGTQMPDAAMPTLPSKRRAVADLPEADAAMVDVFSKHVSSKLPQSVLLALREMHKSLAENIDQMLKVRNAVHDITNDLDVLRRGEIPKGSKPYVAKGNQVTMNEVKIVEGGENFALALPEGTSLADAKKIAYVWYLKVNKSIDLLAKNHALSNLEMLTDFEAFTEAASRVGNQHASVIAAMGIKSLPPGLFDSESLSKVKAQELFVATAHKCAERIIGEKKKADLQVTKRAQVIDKLEKMNPQEKLQNAIDARIRERWPGKARAANHEVDHVALATGTSAADCVKDSKNTGGPAGKPKTAAKAKPKAKGHPKNPPSNGQKSGSDRAKGNKPKQPEKGKGKGKGKSPTHPGKGKGKSKAKGKDKGGQSTKGKGGRQGKGGGGRGF